MLSDSEFEYRWKLSLWEHEPGKSRVEKEFAEFQQYHQRDYVRVGKRMSLLQKRDVLYLERTQDIKVLKGSGGLSEICIQNPNVRFIGFVDKNVAPPIFHALLFYHKKSNELPEKIFSTVQRRFEEFKLNQK